MTTTIHTLNWYQEFTLKHITTIPKGISSLKPEGPHWHPETNSDHKCHVGGTHIPRGPSQGIPRGTLLNLASSASPD